MSANGDTANGNGDAPQALKPSALGWTDPQPYDYAAANQVDSAAAQGAGLSAGDHLVDWAGAGKVYEWKDEYGDIGPEIPELEKELFNNEFISRSGNEFSRILAVKVITEATEQPAPIRSFKDAGLHPVMLSNIEKCGYEVPTPVQAYTIPAVTNGHDLIAAAQTGSGKTAAFLIPTLSKLMGKAKKLAAPRPNTSAGDYVPVTAEPLILVVAPTRELCCQIFDEARRLCYRSMLRPCIAYGGAPSREQRIELGKGCDVLIATPGRLLDFMKDPRVISMRRLRYTIIDEADEMLHPDWEAEMATIMSSNNVNEDADHQFLLFSATFNKHMRKLAKQFLAQDHIRIRIGRTGAILNSVLQKVYFVEGNLKQKALYDLIIDMPPARTMVFVKSKKTADFVDDFLFNLGLPSTSIHSDRTQREREDAIRAFRNGKAPILVTTGVAARGIDVRNVMHVINFDLPAVEHGGEDEYIHRIGRTARIGNEGLATSFYNDNDEALGPFLAKILMESKQEVPDFLAAFKPEDESMIEWHDDSGVEDELETDPAVASAAWGNSTGEAANGWGNSDANDAGNVAAGSEAWVSTATGDNDTAQAW